MSDSVEELRRRGLNLRPLLSVYRETVQELRLCLDSPDEGRKLLAEYEKKLGEIEADEEEVKKLIAACYAPKPKEVHVLGPEHFEPDDDWEE